MAGMAVETQQSLNCMLQLRRPKTSGEIKVYTIKIDINSPTTAQPM